MFVVDVCNGIGDRFTNILGASVISRYTDEPFTFSFINLSPDRTYDASLFSFKLASTLSGDIKKIKDTNVSTILSPPNVYRYLSNVSFHTICDAYVHNARYFTPCHELEMCIPCELSNAYGIHLRRSDKIVSESNQHENTISEHNRIMDAVLSDIQTIIQCEVNPIFFLCSEDYGWKTHVRDLIHSKSNGNITFIDVNTCDRRKGAQDFLEFFALSRCKAIFTTVKYSTFSIMASLVGNVPIYTYAHLCDNYSDCLLHFWLPVIRNAHLERMVTLERRIVFN